MREDGWLVEVGDDTVLASAEVAHTRKERRRGLRGRDDFEGVLVLRPCRQVHTFGLGFPIDVAFCRADGEVIRVTTLEPKRVSLPALRAAFAVEAKAGSFARWNLAPRSVLEVR